MASQSPPVLAAGLATKEPSLYLLGWGALSLAMNQGVSWSGNERNVCFMNAQDGTFADASTITGLDHKDDARAVVSVDWDQDGDLDLWFRNRTGPALRFHRNDTEGQHWITLELRGVTSNRDAVGARVLVVPKGGRRQVREVVAGDGYLSQSTKCLHFGLGDKTAISSITVHWPGGASEQIAPPAVDARYRVVQGLGVAEHLSARKVKIEAGPLPVRDPPASTRVVLRVPVFLPLTLAQAAYPKGRPRRASVINLWSKSCPPCVSELGLWTAKGQMLETAAVDTVALCVDPPADHEAARLAFEEAQRAVPLGMPKRAPDLCFASPEAVTCIHVFLQHIRILPEGPVFPASLLVDGAGQVQVLYLGTVEPETLAADARIYAGPVPLEPSRRSAFSGRWYFQAPRDLEGLSRNLRAEKLHRDAAWFLHVARRLRSREGR